MIQKLFKRKPKTIGEIDLNDPISCHVFLKFALKKYKKIYIALKSNNKAKVYTKEKENILKKVFL